MITGLFQCMNKLHYTNCIINTALYQCITKLHYTNCIINTALYQCISKMHGLVLPTRKHGRGAAKNLEFDKIRKFGPIALIIKDGETSPCCENYTIFTSRWLVKHHVDLSHPSWHDLPDNEKEELIARVQADFVLDWTKMNHRDTVTKILGKRFNHIRYELHKIYKSYKTNEEALANMPELVTPTTWVKLSARWSSVEFMISLIDVDCAIFYMFII
ncbi:hypothetical protein I3842_02G043400 [Carya illinoinensis]|uniref:Uncharacterized protein n=1 Tax=Carya illinoinensis TaxID=32201 RepID=A0A922FS88_CARIL|nr:hypothetical protein I3842_02G043400 [Carya illinoinensis]KAG6725672.1 hypothetical protein I3842_02G043400 [Carya illinoinensis]